MMNANHVIGRVCVAGLLALAMIPAGCSAVGAIAAKVEREGSHDVKAKYEGLGGKTFAVVVAADRAIQGDHPLLTELMIERMTQRLANNTNVPRAAGFVPPLQVQKYLVEHSNWTAMSLTDLAKELGGVDRLVYVDLYEFRLNDPGNAYLWEGIAAGNVSVVETDSPVPDDFAFQQEIQIKFPDAAGMGPNDLSAAAVRTELARRFIERACWLMYNHEEKNHLEY